MFWRQVGFFSRHIVSLTIFPRQAWRLKLLVANTLWRLNRAQLVTNYLVTKSVNSCSVMLLTTFQERPSTPLRVWIGGYTLHCVLHVGFVY